MLKLLEYESVEYRHWIGQEEFIAMVGSSFIFPGLTGVKLSALIGYKAAGITGLLLAVLSLNLPGLLMAILGYQWLTSHNGPVMRKIMIGVQYGALALLAAASYSVAQGVVDMYFSIPIALCCFYFFSRLNFLECISFLWVCWIYCCMFFSGSLK